MARSLSQTLAKASAVPIPSPTPTNFSPIAKPNLLSRHLYSLSSSSFLELTQSEAEARAVEKIEDAIHTIIIRRSRPDWLPFVPGASYWVPPRRHSYGVAEIVHELSNALTEEEFNSLTTFQGWPSSAFYLNHDASKSAGGLTRSINGSSFDEEG